MNMTDVPTTMDPMALRRLEWHMRLVSVVLPRLVGSEADKWETIKLILGSIELGFCDGIEEAGSLVAQIRNGAEQHSRILGIVEDACIKLAAANRSGVGLE